MWEILSFHAVSQPYCACRASNLRKGKKTWFRTWMKWHAQSATQYFQFPNGVFSARYVAIIELWNLNWTQCARSVWRTWYVMQQPHMCRCTVIVYAHAEHCAHTWCNFGGFYMGPGVRGVWQEAELVGWHYAIAFLTCALGSYWNYVLVLYEQHQDQAYLHLCLRGTVHFFFIVFWIQRIDQYDESSVN